MLCFNSIFLTNLIRNGKCRRRAGGVAQLADLWYYNKCTPSPPMYRQLHLPQTLSSSSQVPTAFHSPGCYCQRSSSDSSYSPPPNPRWRPHVGSFAVLQPAVRSLTCGLAPHVSDGVLHTSCVLSRNFYGMLYFLKM